LHFLQCYRWNRLLSRSVGLPSFQHHRAIERSGGEKMRVGGRGYLRSNCIKAGNHGLINFSFQYTSLVCLSCSSGKTEPRRLAEPESNRQSRTVPVSKSPKVTRQITSQKFRQPADNGSMVVNIAVTIESSPLAVMKHKSARERFSVTSTLRSELRLQLSTDGCFLWSSAFIELTSLQSNVQMAGNMPNPRRILSY
jgi:hypothetical protein